jgi:hypothetical protein
VPLSIIIFAGVSYAAIVHLYAAAYLAILYFNPNAIDYGDPSYTGMDVITAYYLASLQLPLSALVISIQLMAYLNLSSCQK